MTEPKRRRIQQQLERSERDQGAVSGNDYKDQFYRRFLAELSRRLAQFKAASTAAKDESERDPER